MCVYLKILHAGCLLVLVYLQPFWCNSLIKNVCRRPKLQTIYQKPFFRRGEERVHSRSRSSMLTNLKRPPLLLVIMSSKYVPICNRFHTIKANSRKITFSTGVPLFEALVRGEPPHPGVQNFVTTKLESLW